MTASPTPTTRTAQNATYQHKGRALSFISKPPAGLTRLFFRVPLWLFKRGLAWPLGNRIARITHRGRKSGRIRQTVVEVVRFDPRTREIVIMSAWQGKTDWYRNLQAAPALEVRTGRVAYRPAQRLLDADETYQEFRGYLRRHPWIARYIYPRIFGMAANFTPSELRAQVDATFCGITFRPAGSAPPGWSQSS
ncbi:MAG: nitroreductase family deazaflavin-dependent oxidoreductase [Chloroflexota bacterium]